VTALHGPLDGRAAVSRLFLRVAARRMPGSRIELRVLNGLPALMIEYARTERRQAPRGVIGCQLDAEGRIVALHVVLAPSKLAGLRFGSS
jgi:RNA polymerase sigma-70 factor (ECF subfamily)